ncbi:hypothetical protein Micbo1qcDRAFT_175570 [Microdochium bolleyi]|uniref:BZIP domain-containing protein n=1 Tax=Microdochium bolleyi TaxID=196109 RepID=A0A136J2M7_9PEZI|nr:hypothetical protein Micbo1qcDRAFT_175570 [Microdochium bolleyi]
MATSDHPRTASTTSARGARPLATSYADLMKPDEDWRNLADASERRKIQNRLAQRAYRRNMRDRTREVEKLKKQLEYLQGTLAQTRSPTPPVNHDSPPYRSFAGSHSTSPMIMATPAMPTWSQLPDHSQLGSLGLGGAGFSFDPSFPGGGVTVGMSPASSTSTGQRPRALTEDSCPGSTIRNVGHVRSISSGPVMGAGDHSHVPYQWSTSVTGRENLMSIGSMSPTSNSVLGLASQGSFIFECDPGDSVILQDGPAFLLGEDPRVASLSSHPDASSQLIWQSVCPPAISPPNLVPALSTAEPSSMPPNMPKTCAPPPHFAIPNNHVHTLIAECDGE